MRPVNPRFCSKNPSLNDRSLHLAALIHVYYIRTRDHGPECRAFYVSLRELHKPGWFDVRAGREWQDQDGMAGAVGGRKRVRPAKKLFGGGCGPNGSTAPRRTLPTRESTRRGARAVPLDTWGAAGGGQDSESRGKMIATPTVDLLHQRLHTAPASQPALSATPRPPPTL